MYSPETIAAMSDEAAREAASLNKVPYVPWDRREVDAYGVSRTIPFPNLGAHRPIGWRLVEHRLVDAYGWGDESEPALTPRGMRAWVTEHLTSGSGYAIIEVGQFQVVVGRFERSSAEPHTTYP